MQVQQLRPGLTAPTVLDGGLGWCIILLARDSGALPAQVRWRLGALVGLVEGCVNDGTGAQYRPGGSCPVVAVVRSMLGDRQRIDGGRLKTTMQPAASSQYPLWWGA